MKAYVIQIKRLLAVIAGFIPTRVPIGMTEFTEWSQSIIDTYALPNNDSIRFALASMVMHGGQSTAYKSKFAFFLMLRAAMSKQVAGAYFHEIKQKQIAEATAQQQAQASDEKQPSQQTAS